jgi:hypothetical protein
MAPTRSSPRPSGCTPRPCQGRTRSPACRPTAQPTSANVAVRPRTPSPRNIETCPGNWYLNRFGRSVGSKRFGAERRTGSGRRWNRGLAREPGKRPTAGGRSVRLVSRHPVKTADAEWCQPVFVLNWPNSRSTRARADGQAERLLLAWTGLRCRHGRATEGVACGRPRVRSRPWRRLSPRPDGEDRDRRRSQLVFDGRRVLSRTRERDRQD